jgi:hypothetical protein
MQLVGVLAFRRRQVVSKVFSPHRRRRASRMGLPIRGGRATAFPLLYGQQWIRYF